MGIHVIGFQNSDEKFQQMKDVWDACEKAGVKPPTEVSEFFDYEAPGVRGRPVAIEGTPCCRKWNEEEMQDGFEVDVTKLPEGVTVIRFYNTY